MEKAFNRCFLPRLLVSILFHYPCPLFCRQHCLCGRGSLETMWPGRDLKKPLMLCSEVLFRAKRRNLSGCPINYWRLDYWNGITSPDWAAPSISQQRHVVQTPGEIVFWLVSPLSSFRDLSVFSLLLVTDFSRVWVWFVSPFPVAWNILRAALTEMMIEQRGEDDSLCWLTDNFHIRETAWILKWFYSLLEKLLVGPFNTLPGCSSCSRSTVRGSVSR